MTNGIRPFSMVTLPNFSTLLKNFNQILLRRLGRSWSMQSNTTIPCTILLPLSQSHWHDEDAVEHYNPMHDLAAAVAVALARRTGTPELLCYPIEKETFGRKALWTIDLTEAELSRKQQAARSYLELAREVEL